MPKGSAMTVCMLCTVITAYIQIWHSRQLVVTCAAGAVTCVPVDPKLSFLRNQGLYDEAAFQKVLSTGYQSLLPHQSKTKNEKICVVTSDDRDMTELTQGRKILDIPYHQMSVYHHLLYAIRHGYDYRHIRTLAPEGYHATWPKISVLLQLLAEDKYDLLVYMDADAYVTDLSVPLDSMFKVARFTSEHSLMLARDPPEDVNLSKAGTLNVNTGFIVARNHSVTRQTLQAVLDCPETIAECEHLKKDWPHEQGALSSYILPHLQPNTLLETSCDLFNGYAGESSCEGRFISHLWNQKHQLNTIMMNDMVQMLLTGVGASLTAL